jgi:hypothetical protein
VDEKVAWAAGFFDGEGCIYKDRLILSQKVLAPLEFFQSLYGGNMYSPYKTKYPAYQLVIIKKAEVFRCLVDLEPYLLVKGDKARMVIQRLRKINE